MAAQRKTGRPAWFKLFGHYSSLINAASDKAVGQALKASLAYLNGEPVPSLSDPLALAVLAVLKESVDESISDYQRRVEGGKKGASIRWDT